MPREDKEKILNEVLEKVNEVSSTIDSLFSLQKKQYEVSSETVSQQEEISSEEVIKKQEEKNYKIKTIKLLEEIRDNKTGDVDGGGGGLGNILGLMLGAGGSAAILPMLTPILAAVAASIGTILVGLAAAGVGTILYEKFIKPELDKVLTESKDIITKPSTTREKIKSDTGEELFYTKDQTTGKGKVITSSEKNKQIEKGASEIDFQPITAIVQETREGGKIDVATTTPTVISSSMQGAKIEDIQKAIESRESKIAGEEEGFRGREGKIQRYAQQIAMWEFDLRSRLKDLAETELKIAKTPQGYTAALAEGNRQQEILENQVLTESKSIKRRLQDDLDNNKITNRDINALYSTSNLFSASETELINKIKAFRKDTDGSIIDLPLGKTDDEIYKNVYASAENNFGSPPEILAKTKTGDISLHELMQHMESKKAQAEVTAASRMYSAGGAPMAYEGIIEGTKMGSRIIAGENYTPEVVISTKPNKVTESIGNNLYTKLMENVDSDVFSTQRETMILGTALNNTTQEYNDAYKIAPLISTPSNATNPIIVNNMVGGMNNGTYLETNGQFNGAGLVPDKHENVLEKVYMDYYKAAML